MTTNISGVIDRVLLHEGDVADVNDGKGMTYWGQTLGWLNTWGLAIPDSREAAKVNYALWLKKVGLDHVCEADPALGAAVVDWAVNSGHKVAIRALQRGLNVSPDGDIGPDTRHALFACTPIGLKRTLVHVHCARLEFLGQIISNQLEQLRTIGKLSLDKLTYGEYAEGWMKRMATNIRADLI